MVVLAEVVTGPAPRGRRYGLFDAAAGPMDLPRLSNGVQFDPVSCGTADLYPYECDTPSADQAFDDSDGYVVASPFVARATYKCRSVGTDAAELEAKVRQRLENGEQNVAEAGMAIALNAAATPLGADDPTSIRSIVGELEQWLYGIATAGYGMRGVLHAPIRFVPYAAAAGLLIKEGPVWVTPTLTVWSFGGGYPDNGRIYISGTAAVWRAENVTVPDPAQTFDRTINQYRLTADREYAVAFDCLAARVDFAPDITPS